MIQRNQRRPRTVSFLAAIAAMTLLVTAWTSRDSRTPDSATPGPERHALGVADPDAGDDVSVRRPSPRFSLMLFRFN